MEDRFTVEKKFQWDGSAIYHVMVEDTSFELHKLISTPSQSHAEDLAFRLSRLFTKIVGDNV